MSHESEAAKIREIASRLGVDPRWLDALINFETAGTYDPLAKNPTSSARGLIQVIDSTAQSEFGAADSLALVSTFPDFDSQMENVVWPYLAKYMPFSTKQSLYLAVFYPRYRFVDPLTPFPANVQAANPGITTPQDYIDYVDRVIRVGNLRIPKALPAALGLGVAGLILWAILRKRQRGR